MRPQKDTLPESWQEKFSNSKPGSERIYYTTDKSIIMQALKAIILRNELGVDLFILHIGSKCFTIKCLVRNNPEEYETVKKGLLASKDQQEIYGLQTKEELKNILVDEDKLDLYLMEQDGYQNIFNFFLEKIQMALSQNEIKEMMRPLVEAGLSYAGLTLKQ